ncbi:MAG TPA: hypothetical protein VHX38_24730 [Pseudonocardiaceae bacterium]|jgi:hypothetical protein|nr:hypothetical protein [Pseudonocardiaceae bacterium]
MLSKTARILARAALPAVALAILAATAAPAGAAVVDPLPIGPNQYFSGLVNGARADATIRTDCLTPVGVGHPSAGQYVEGQLNSPVSSNDLGYTGSAGRSLVVTLQLPTSSGVIGIGTLSGYNYELAIPTSISVPCSGSGVVVFAPAPTSPTAKPATVSVTLASPVG